MQNSSLRMKSIIEKRFELIKRNTAEIIESNELLKLLEENKPRIYHGFEPSSKSIHIGYLIGIQKHLDFIDAGLDLTLLLADVHAWLNEKGDWDKIKEMSELYKKNFIACGIPKDKVNFVLGSSFQLEKDYWLDVMRLSLKVRMQRAKRSMTIIGREEEDPHIAQFFYPLMQAVDIKHLKADIVFGDLAQRKIHMLARDELENIGYKKPVAIHHQEMNSLTLGQKMSSSKPETTVFLDDKPEIIEKKITNAYCEAGKLEANPIMEIINFIIFGRLGVKQFKVEREKKHGGDVIFKSYEEVKEDFLKSKLHPLDLKKAVAKELIKILAPIKKRLQNFLK